MKENYMIRHLFKKYGLKCYNSMSKGLLSNIRNGNSIVLYEKNVNKNLMNLLYKKHYNTYKNRVFNSAMYNNTPSNYMNNPENNNMNHLQNNSNYKYENPNNYYQPKYINNLNNETNENNTTYQYFSIFGSTAMCLIKPIFPDYITNKNKVTIYGKGGFQFVFMRKQSNSNKYDKNNKMNIFIKINSLSNVLSLNDVEKLKNPIIIKGSNNNYLTIDKHKEKKDHIVIKYKYQPSNSPENNFNDMNNMDTDINENMIINDVNDEKRNNFEELHVSFSFSEFLLFQKAANLLLPQLIGWAKQY